MDKNKFVDLLTGKLREKANKYNWSLNDIQYAITTVKEVTDNISHVTEEPNGYMVHFLAGSNVPNCIGHLYNIHSYLRVPVYARMNGILASITSTE